MFSRIVEIGIVNPCRKNFICSSSFGKALSRLVIPSLRHKGDTLGNNPSPPHPQKAISNIIFTATSGYHLNQPVHHDNHKFLVNTNVNENEDTGKSLGNIWFSCPRNHNCRSRYSQPEHASQRIGHIYQC